MLHRHCSDEQLLAHADDELRWLGGMRVSWHLARCWYCRGRLEELERQAHTIAKNLLDDDFPWPLKIAEAKAEFQTRRQRLERPAAPPQRVTRANLPALGRRAWVALAAALTLIAASGVWSARRSAAPSARAIVADCEKRQAALEQLPVHQVFEVQIRQTKPVPHTYAGRLEVWSDTPKRRFAAHWVGEDGVLLQALWRPEPEHEYVLDSRLSRTPRTRVVQTRQVSAAELTEAGLEPQVIEREFLRWLESRDWTAVGVRSGLLSFVADDETELQVAECQANLCLSARRQQGRVRAEVTVEIDRESLRPRLQMLALESGNRRTELSLQLKNPDTMRVAAFTAGIFQPNTSGLRLPDLGVGNNAKAVAVPPELGSVDRVEKSELRASRLIEAHYALHKARACEGEPVEVLYDEDRVTVRGMAETPQRKSDILTALAELGSPAWLNVEIHTVGELHGPPTSRTRVYAAGEDANNSDATASPDGGGLAVDVLQRYFEREGPGGGVTERDRQEAILQSAARFSNRAVTLSDAMLRHAWALRRLAESFPATLRMTPQSRWLLQHMVQDHITALREQSGAVRTLLAPLWGAPVDSGPEIGARWATGNWTSDVLQVFQTAERVHSHLYSLFVAGDAGSTDSAEQVGQRTVEELASISWGLNRAEEASARADKGSRARLAK